MLFRSRLAELHKVGMDPVEVGEKVLAGIRNNDLHIFPHPEFRDELREIFDEILTALPEGATDPRRLAFEEGRRRVNADAKAKSTRH